MTTSFTPIKYEVTPEKDVIQCLLVCGSSLFLGLRNGKIIEWTEPGKIKRSFTSAQKNISMVTCLLQCGEILWSGSWEGSIELWSLTTGECIKTINDFPDFAVWSLCLWKQRVIAGCNSPFGLQLT